MKMKKISIALSILFLWLLALSTDVFPAQSPVTGEIPPKDNAQSSIESSDVGDNLKQQLAELKELQKGNDISAQLDAMKRISILYQRLGQHNNALNVLTQAIKLSESIDNPALKAGLLNLQAEVYLSLGQPDKAGVAIDAGFSLVAKVDAPDVTAALFNTSGNLLASKKSFPEALAAYKKGLSSARENTSLTTAAIYANMARVYIADAGSAPKGSRFRTSRNDDGSASLYGDASESAFSTLQRALQVYEALPDTHDKAYGMMNAGKSCLLLEAIAPTKTHASVKAYGELAYRSFSGALKVAKKISDTLAQSYAYGYLGQMYEHGGRFEEALQLSRNAVFTAQQANAPQSLYLWHWQIGRILKLMGDMDGAITAYDQAVDTLQAVRQQFHSVGVTGGATFSGSVEPVYFGLADLLLLKARALNDEKSAQPYLFRARRTVEMLKTAELRDYFQDPCVDSRQSRIVDLDSISKTTAVLYVIPFKSRIELLLGVSSGIKQYTVAVAFDEYASTVKELRNMLEKRTTKEYRIPSRKLYDWLIKPMEAQLKESAIETIVYVPDEVLRTVPLSALYDGEKFLVDSYAIAVTQGLTLTDPHPLERKNMEVLVAGITEARQGFPALASVNGEMEAINGLYKSSMLKDKNFTIPAVKSDLDNTPYSIFHIASHGEFYGDIKKTFLLTWDDRMTMNNLDEFIKEGRVRTKPVELLTLSACQTAAGDDRAALGLAGVAIKAGAKSALATLWYISDEASSKLVEDFYKELKEPKNTKAKALKNAQELLMHDRRYAHPYYWSSFILIGNWL